MTWKVVPLGGFLSSFTWCIQIFNIYSGSKVIIFILATNNDISKMIAEIERGGQFTWDRVSRIPIFCLWQLVPVSWLSLWINSISVPEFTFYHIFCEKIHLQPSNLHYLQYFRSWPMFGVISECLAFIGLISTLRYPYNL